jgi:spore coat protein H
MSMNRIRRLIDVGVLAVLAGTIFSGRLTMTVAGKPLLPEDVAAAETFFTNSSLPVLRIQIRSAQLNALRRDERTYVKATMTEGATVYTNVLMRLKGGAGSFRPVDDKPGFTLKLDDGDSFHGLKKIHLNNSVQDNSFLSEWLCGQMFREAGVPAPRAKPVLVELNGRRLGLMVLLESVDQQFLARYFKNTHGNVYSSSANMDINGPLDCIGGREGTERADLKALETAVRASDPARLARVLDMERFISFLALEVMLCHWDGYTANAKNYLVYHDLDTQKMVFIPHDLDQLLQNPNWPILPRSKGMVSRSVLADRATRQRYLDRVTELGTKVFMAPVLTRRLDAMVGKLQPQIAAYDPNLARRFVQEANELRMRVINRAGVLQAERK